LPALRSSGDRGEARFRLLRVAGRLPIRPVARIQGPLARGRPDPTALAATRLARAPRVRGLRRGRPPAARQRRVDGDPDSGRGEAAAGPGDGTPASRREDTDAAA